MPADDHRQWRVVMTAPDDESDDGSWLKWWEWLLAFAVSCAVAGGVVLVAWLTA
jgi:hypothetical protein